MVETNKIINKLKGKVMCSRCKKLMRIRGMVIFKGEDLCYPCRAKLPSYQNFIKLTNKMNLMHKGFTFEKARDKVYQVKGDKHINKEGETYYTGRCNFPSILIGKKFKIQLIQDKNENPKN
jgi:hypothetical protein